MQTQTKKLTVIAMLSAVAYLIMVVGRIPIVLFLKYDPKDVIIAIGGFLFGPLTAFTISVLVSFVEMLTVSTTGFIGLLMNIISSCSFACTAAIIYKKKHNYKGAILGLIAGWLVTTTVMILWNYLITPMYLGYPREAVVELLIPVFLPFNLLKGGLNASIVMLIYKPLSKALRSANLMPIVEETSMNSKKVLVKSILVSSLIIISCILSILAFQGII
ncbi:MAG TPA: ECF transporter S component [Clostridiales bacterium]|nr:ECF transporter S component [Clostridiales bacterium]